MSMDRELALSRVGGDTELLQEIAVIFLDDYPKVLDEVKQAVDRGDARAVERAAHGLKGSVSNFGARAAVEAASHLEILGRAGQVPDMAEGILALERALRELHHELEAL